MEAVPIDLHARRTSDLASLQPLAAALEARGQRAVLSVGPGVEAASGLPQGPLRCELRVVVEGAGAPLPVPLAEGEALAVLWESAEPAERWLAAGALPEALRQAALVFVAGEAQARALGAELGVPVVAAGLVRLDALLQDRAAARAQARRALAVPEGMQVVLYAPSADPVRSAVHVVGGRIAELATEAIAIAILPGEWPPAWLASHRALAAGRFGVALLDPQGATARPLAAADLVCGDESSLLREAEALGVPTVVIEAGVPGASAGLPVRVSRIGDLAATISGLLSGPAPRASAAALELCRVEPGAAQRVAAALAAHRQPGTGEERSAPISEFFGAIEARVSFGQAAEARRDLEAHLAHSASSAGYRLLASIHRREGAYDASARAAEIAERMAREDLAGALCERGRIHVERDQLDAARGCFEAARDVDPELPAPQVGLGSLALHRGEGAAAERHFRAALGREKSGRTWSGLGLALLAQGRSRDALAPLESALDLDAECTAALYGLVQAAFQTGELALAEVRVRRFVEAYPGNLDLAFTLAGLRAEVGDRAGADEMLARISVFDPSYPGLAELAAKLRA